MDRKRPLAVLLLTALFLAAAPAAQAGKDTVGYLNIGRIMNESTLGLEARDKFMNEYLEREKVLKAKLAEAQELERRLEERKSVMGREELEKTYAQYQKAFGEYRKQYQEDEKAMAELNRNLAREVLKKADPFMKEVVEERDYSMVLTEPDAIGYLNPRVDITDQVLEKMAKKYGKPPETKAP